MSELLFIRHAETDLAGTFCGHSDPPVNSRGREQIAGLLEALRPGTISAVYTSDLLRAYATARALSDHHSVPIIKSRELREVNFGDWEGLTWTQIEQRNPQYAQRWMTEFPKLTAPNGERFEAFEQRILEACARITTMGDAGRIAVVTHAGVMRVMLQKFCGYTDEQAWNSTRDYCCSFRVDQKFLATEVLR